MQPTNFIDTIFAIAFVLISAFLLSSLIVACVAGIVLAYGFWNKNKKRHERALDTTLLEISLPRDNEIKIDAAEQLFSSLTSIKGTKGIFSFLKISDHISFEIV